MRSALFLATAVTLLLIAAASTWRTAATESMPLGNTQVLAVSFAHADHAEQPCTVCHHEFLDNSGAGLCFDCHRTHPQTAALVERQFHTLCRGCHLEQQQLGQSSGPVRRCSKCHHQEDEP